MWVGNSAIYAGRFLHNSWELNFRFSLSLAVSRSRLFLSFTKRMFGVARSGLGSTVERKKKKAISQTSLSLMHRRRKHHPRWGFPPPPIISHSQRQCSAIIQKATASSASEGMKHRRTSSEAQSWRRPLPSIFVSDSCQKTRDKMEEEGKVIFAESSVKSNATCSMSEKRALSPAYPSDLN